MLTMLIILAIAILCYGCYTVGRFQGRDDTFQLVGTSVVDQLRFFKKMADDLLRQRPHQAELHLHFGDEAVDCRSTMETAQFSQALKGVIDHFKPWEEAHPE